MLPHYAPMMRGTSKHRFAVLALLGITMHFMAQISPLWMPDSGRFTVQICTAQGEVKTITINENGRKAPGKSARTKSCAFCMATGCEAAIPGQASIPLPAWVFVTRTKKIDAHNFIQAHNNKSNPARAPPVYT